MRRILGFAAGIGLGLGLAFALTRMLRRARTELPNAIATEAREVVSTVGGRLRYVSCLRYLPRESDGSYREPRERAVVYVDARLDRVLENPGDACSGATYAAFPELEKLTR